MSVTTRPRYSASSDSNLRMSRSSKRRPARPCPPPSAPHGRRSCPRQSRPHDPASRRGCRPTPAAELRLQPVGADLNPEPAGDLRHRLEQSERNRPSPRRFHTRCRARAFAAAPWPVRCWWRGAEKPNALPVTDQSVFGRQRLLDLQDQVGRRPHFPRAADECRSRGAVFRIGKAGTAAGGFLHHHLGTEGNAAPAQAGVMETRVSPNSWGTPIIMIYDKTFMPSYATPQKPSAQPHIMSVC